MLLSIKFLQYSTFYHFLRTTQNIYYGKMNWRNFIYVNLQMKTQWLNEWKSIYTYVKDSNSF